MAKKTNARPKNATVSSPAVAGIPEAEEQSWFTPARIRLLAIAGGIVVLAALVIWFVIAAGKRKQSYAAAALEQARAAASQNDLAGAVQQYTAVVNNYGGTDAAFEAELGIAQARLVIGQNQLAITGLTSFLKTNPPLNYAAPANGLLGAAYENVDSFALAEAAYRQESTEAGVDYLKANALLDAGRAARLAGQPDSAVAIYQTIIDKYSRTPSVTEAQVRLAELTAKADSR
jgi:TolA-binding protein